MGKLNLLLSNKVKNMIVKRAKLFAKMNEARFLKRRIPLVTYLLVTDRCDLRCSYCFVDVKTKKDELTTLEWINLIDKLYAEGTRMLCFMGGEPLIHKEIDRLVDYAVSKGMIVDMTTNGTQVSKKMDTIKKLDSLMISIDGDEEGHDSNRGEKSFQKAKDAMIMARNAGVIVRINAVMTQQSVHGVDYLLDMADEYDLWITFSITAEFPENAKDLESSIKLGDEDIRKLYKKLKVLKAQGRRVLFSEETIDYVIDYPLPFDQIILRDDKENLKYSQGLCPFGQHMIYVDATGDFYPCASLWNGDLYQPKNCRNDSFEEAWGHMATLKCATCFCPGVPEWNRIMSVKGISDGVKVTFKQAFSRLSPNKSVN